MPNPYNFQYYGNPTMGNPYLNQVPNQQTSQNNPIVWVQGEDGAKNYPVAAGNTVLLMDQTSNVFYLKSTDMNGIPQPLRVFDYTERDAVKEVKEDTSNASYVTKQEFDELKKRLDQISNHQKIEKRRFERDNSK